MAYDPPTYGETGEVYTDKVRNSLEHVRTAAEAAQAAADGNNASVVAASQAADQALEIAEAAKAFVESPTDSRVATLVQDSTSSTGAALLATYGQSLMGEGGRKYRMVLGAIRNTGGGWAPIDDTGHTPTFIDSVSNTTQGIVVNFASAAATKVGAMIVAPDEKLVAEGFQAQASVGIDSATIYVYGPTKEVADYVYYNGSSWISQNGEFTSASFSSGVLTLGHRTIPDADVMCGSVSGRGVMMPMFAGAGAVAANQVKIEFRDWAGTLITTPSTDMKVFVRHGRNGRALVNPNNINTTAYPYSNLWLIGVVEV